ncbi:putative glycosyl transferase [Acidipropionibacterium jensenii]|uniref:Putative glycosyl transferase n=1 Tax=Acidipropionibacterium jensenii TaxID=1749 RepID=A0A3S4W888_9ACTN|nr:glycosyltransferase family 4 protein [Acidipropionibacterium jensenii]VEI03102.1 putative glycosyl transferase [Acidipropionibacterium jensenii]
MTNRQVIVVNQFAAPHGVVGPTRNVDVFSRTPGWSPHFIGANFAHHAKTRLRTDDPRFTLVWVPRYQRNDIRRLVGWLVFTVEAAVTATVRRGDLVYGSSPHLLNPVAALVAARLRGRPYVCEVRDLWPESLVSAGGMSADGMVFKLLSWLEKHLYESAERVVTVVDWSEHFRDLGVDPVGLMEVIPNGSEPDEFRVEESREQLREEFGIHGLTAVFAGSHGTKDGIPLIVNAAERCPEVHFLLVGEGGDKQACVEDAKSRGITNIEFRDPIPKTEVPKLLRACDIGLHVVAPIPVFDKGMSPTKLFDYMAVGVPVVTNARRPLRNVISDDEIGAVVDPDDIASGVRRVVGADPDTRARWFAREQELIETVYSRTAAGKRLSMVLEEVMSEWRDGRSRTWSGRLQYRVRKTPSRLAARLSASLRGMTQASRVRIG